MEPRACRGILLWSAGAVFAPVKKITDRFSGIGRPEYGSARHKAIGAGFHNFRGIGHIDASVNLDHGFIFIFVEDAP